MTKPHHVASGIAVPDSAAVCQQEASVDVKRSTNAQELAYAFWPQGNEKQNPSPPTGSAHLPRKGTDCRGSWHYALHYGTNGLSPLRWNYASRCRRAAHACPPAV